MRRNSWLDQQKEKINLIGKERQYANERMCLDAIIYVLSDKYGFTRDGIVDFIEAYIQERTDSCNDVIADRYGNKDKHYEYYKGKYDRILKSIMGDDFPDFEARYTFDISKTMYEGGINMNCQRRILKDESQVHS